MSTTLTEAVLNAYREGVFPMAESAADESFAFYKPHRRALLPIRDLHVPTRLRRTLKQAPYRVSVDGAFADVIDGCARRESTWINSPIRAIFLELHAQGHAHSIECWSENGTLAGGLYGLAIGAVFCGESMFSNAANASKIALVHLCALLQACGFTTLDSQFANPHLVQFGMYEMMQEEYETLIETEMEKTVLPFDRVNLTHALMLDYLRNQATA